MRILKVILLLLLFLSLTININTLQGQPYSQKYGIGAEFSTIRLIGGEKGDSNINGSGGINFLYDFSQKYAIGYSWNYGTVHPKKENSLFGSNPLLPYKTSLMSNIIYLKAKLLNDKTLNPFVFAGAGLLIWDLQNKSNGNSINAGKTYNTILNTGLGIDWAVNESFYLSPQFKFMLILDQKADNIGTNDVNDKILQFGINGTFYFHRNKDSDHDGIPDKIDIAPKLPEDMDGFQDMDGAPDYDNDNDGIPDSTDAAPLIAEDMDGFEDNDGIPEPDNDWDGILDIYDGAPNDPEDLDGFQDEDGIPDNDNDGDQIPDISDLCPTEMETFNGYRDDDGCPDEVPPPIVEKGGRIVLQGVNFETGSAEITKESYIILDEVYESLDANPEVEIEIQGYTDNTGSAGLNQKLSQDRANSVRSYLISMGIDSYRIKAVGYGPQNPIANNGTEQGRAQNRRIEFLRIE